MSFCGSYSRAFSYGVVKILTSVIDILKFDNMEYGEYFRCDNTTLEGKFVYKTLNFLDSLL